MKRFILLAFICSGMPAFSDGLPDIPLSTTSPINEFQTMQTNKFEYEQTKNYEKAEKANLVDRGKQKIQDMNENIRNVFTRNNTNSKIIKENGQIKIKYNTMEN